jgi:hypothetical protein
MGWSGTGSWQEQVVYWHEGTARLENEAELMSTHCDQVRAEMYETVKSHLKWEFDMLEQQQHQGQEKDRTHADLRRKEKEDVKQMKKERRGERAISMARVEAKNKTKDGRSGRVVIRELPVLGLREQNLLDMVAVQDEGMRKREIGG